MRLRLGPKASFDVEWDYDAPEVSAAIWMADRQLNLMDPKREFWETYGAFVFGGGFFHGLLLGPLFGAFVPWSFDLSMAAWKGAAWGSLFGPLCVGCVYAIELPIFYRQTQQEPSIEGIRLLVRAAAEEIDRLKQDVILINHEHLLIALLRHPSPALDAVLSRSSADIDQLADRIGQEMDKPVIRMDTDDDYAKSSFGILRSAIELAKQAGIPSVDAGHVFLALAGAWPEPTREALAAAGLEIGQVIKEVEERLNSLQQ
jgi:hypothetical protein